MKQFPQRQKCGLITNMSRCFCTENKLQNLTNIFDVKHTPIETTRNNDDVRRRSRSEKVNDCACHTLNVSSPMELSSERARAVDTRVSENQTNLVMAMSRNACLSEECP